MAERFIRFSERVGIVEPPTIQIDSMNIDLRNTIWNSLHSEVKNFWLSLAIQTAEKFRKIPVDEVPASHRCMRWIKEYFYRLQWYEVYDFMEFIIENTYTIFGRERILDFNRKQLLINAFNETFERELSGYRFIEGIITPITNSTEMAEISKAIDSSKSIGIRGAYEHITTALKQLGKKPDPDYRNAIKEAVSAVESTSKQLSGKKSGGLSDALNELDKKISIHKALKSGFLNLYGYSSDKDGIRHAILEKPDIDFDDAKYMIVSCSAFVNYLIAKAQKAGIL